MGLYSCDSDGEWGLRERVQISDGTVKCCESGIVIPAGQPYAMCVFYWSSDFPDWEEDVCFYDLPTERKHEVLDKFGNEHPQCLEVWRLLRRNNFIHGACAPFGLAIDQYNDAWGNAWDDAQRVIHMRRYFELVRTIHRARTRYENGGGPRLHPTERANLESGEWQFELPFTRRPKQLPRAA